MIGVDEAGRGPVFGSLFVAAVSSSKQALSSDVADSKTLSARKIERISTELRNKDTVSIVVVEATADEVDDAESLTTLTASLYATAIDRLSADTTSVTVDAFRQDTDAVERTLERKTTGCTEILAEHKADETYPVVSAASIIAKASRETHMKQLSRQHGKVGSGYPSDPTTRQYLERYIETNRDLPPFARSSWSTSEEFLQLYAPDRSHESATDDENIDDDH